MSLEILGAHLQEALTACSLPQLNAVKNDKGHQVARDHRAMQAANKPHMRKEMALVSPFHRILRAGGKKLKVVSRASR